MCAQNWKFVALPVPEIIGGTQKISAVPGYAHALFSPKFLRGFFRMDAVNTPAKFEVRTLPVPEIIGGTQKIGQFPGYAHAPFSPQFLRGFCSHGPC